MASKNSVTCLCSINQSTATWRLDWLIWYFLLFCCLLPFSRNNNFSFFVLCLILFCGNKFQCVSRWDLSWGLLWTVFSVFIHVFRYTINQSTVRLSVCLLLRFQPINESLNQWKLCLCRQPINQPNALWVIPYSLFFPHFIYSFFDFPEFPGSRRSALLSSVKN